MRKFIVPSKGKIKKWTGFFLEKYQSEDVQRNLFEELVSMAADLQVFNRHNKQHVRLAYLIDCMSLVHEVDDMNMLAEEDLTYIARTAADIGLNLVYFMRDISVLDEVGCLRFEGFCGGDFVVSIPDNDELFAKVEPLFDMKEREWRNAY